MRLALALAAMLACTGCSRIMGTSDAGRTVAPVGPYPDGASGLQALFADVLDAARRDDRDRVHDILATTLLTDGELDRLLGPAAPPLRARYQALMGALVNRGAVELVAQVYDRKLDAVEAFAVDGTASGARPEDRAIARALQVRVPVYAARIKRSGDAGGLRYDFFVYLDGHWRTGNQLGKYLPPPASSDGGVRPR
jgi:hypothetical protein